MLARGNSGDDLRPDRRAPACMRLWALRIPTLSGNITTKVPKVRARARERERALLGTMISNGGSWGRPRHGLRTTTRFHASPPTHGGVAFYMAKFSPDSAGRAIGDACVGARCTCSSGVFGGPRTARTDLFAAIAPPVLTLRVLLYTEQRAP